MEIQKAETKRDLQEFVELPYGVQNDPIWIAPLRDEQKAQFNVKGNPMLTHCETALFLAKEDDKVVGRIAAFIDKAAVDYWKQPIGLFGSYECNQDPSISKALLSSAEQWLKEGRQMKAMRGPWSFASQEWGDGSKEGFTPSPVIMAPYNPPWYNDQLEAYGLNKVKDLLVYYIDAREGYQIPERILTLTDRIQKRYNVRVRPVNIKELEKDVMAIVNLSNLSIADNWGYYTVTMEEGRAYRQGYETDRGPKSFDYCRGRSG